MKKLLLISVLLGIAISGIAQQRIIASKTMRDKAFKENPPVLETENQGSDVLKVDPKLWPPESAEVGLTYYDNQTNCSPQNRIFLYGDGTIGTTFIYGMGYTAFADRGTGYNYFDGNSWGPYPTQRIEAQRTGWPSYSSWGANGEINVAHYSSTLSGIQGLAFSKRVSKGTGTWSSFDYHSPATTAEYIWPRMTTSGIDNSIIHLIALTMPVGNGGTLYQGMDGALLYSRSSNGGQTWDIQHVMPTGLNSNFYNHISADQYEFAYPKGNTIAILVGGDWTDLVLEKSIDGGNSWTKTVVWQHPYPFWVSGTPTDTFYCADGSHSIAIDNTGKIHIAFGINRTYADASGSYWFPLVDGVGYWNEDMATFSDNVNALSPYGDFGSELVENYNLIGWTQDINNNGTWDILGSVGAYYIGASSMPQLVIDDQNNVFLIYSSVTETYNNGVQDYRHLWARGSNDDGQTWDDFYDLTSDLIYIFSECIVPSCSPQTDNYIHLIYQEDNEPGLAVRGDLDPYGENRMRYMKVLKSDIVSSQAIIINTFPYTQSFENGTGEWMQSSNDNFEWTYWTGPTPTSNTGPNFAYEGYYYLYTESSSPNYPSKTAGLYAKFDFSTLLNPNLSFWYHMYGNTMGSLKVQVSTNNGGSWTDLWTLTGNQGEQWNNAIVSLSAYSNMNNIMVRYWAITGSNQYSDIAVDYIEVNGMLIPEINVNPTSLTITEANKKNGTKYDPNENILELKIIQNTSKEILDENEFVISNVGNANLIITSITDNQNWMNTSGYSSTPFTIFPGNNQSVFVNIDWTLVGELTQYGFINIYSDDPDEPVVTVNITAIPDVIPSVVLTPQNQSISSSPGSFSVTVNSNITWTVNETCGWLTCDPLGGTNTGQFTVNYDENTSINQRTCTITVTGSGATATCIVTQAGASPVLTLNPTSQNVGSSPGTFNISVTSNTTWAINESCNWLSCNPITGTGNGQFTVSYEENTTIEIRNCTITVTGSGINATCIVTQAAGAANLTIDPATQNINFTAGSFQISVISNISWDVSETCDWLDCDPLSGSGNGQFTVNYNENPDINPRTCIITVEGGGITSFCVVIQEGIVTILENQLDNFIQIYPNPIYAGKINIKFDLNLLIETIDLEIYNSSGISKEKLNIKNINNNTIKLNISDYPAGIYYLKFMHIDFSIMKKIIVIR